MPKLTDRRVIWFALVLCVLAMAGFTVLGRGFPPDSPGIVALQLAFSKATFAGILQQWGPAGVRAFQMTTLWVDSWFPVAYALLLSSLLAALARGSSGRLTHPGDTTLALPWLAMGLDWLENSLHLLLLRDPGNLSATLVWVASVAAAVKWGLIAVTVLVLVLGLYRRLRTR